MPFDTPLNFAYVGDGIYRSGFPVAESLDYLTQLGLKSAVCLQPEDLGREAGGGVRRFCEEQGIELLEADVGENKEPFTVSIRYEIRYVCLDLKRLFL